MIREVLNVCEAVRRAGGRAMMVGGSVRDRLLGIGSKDYDLEVYGIEPPRLRAILEQIAVVNTVGEHFAVYKLAFYDSKNSRYEVDVTIPRRESKSGRGHRGFTIEGDPLMSFEEAARRRDFTINAILYDPLTDEIVDPYGGREDLEQKVLRAVAADTFVEDSLRVLRAVQLAARFEMRIDADTVRLCRSIDLSDLPHERIWGEIEKLLLLADRPSIGLNAALELGVLDKLFPELRAMVGCPLEDSRPERDVFTHTLLCLDETARISLDLTKEKRVALMLAALSHNLGKTVATPSDDGSLESPDRERAALDLTRELMDRLELYTLGGYRLREQVLALVEHHMKPERYYEGRDRVSDGDFRRLALKVDLDLLYRLARADALARDDGSSAAKPDWFIERARSLGVEHGAPDPLLKGRHLVEIGFEPGPGMGEILRRVYEMQLDGEVSDLEGALSAARRLIDERD